jgi:hypothetical protein
MAMTVTENPDLAELMDQREGGLNRWLGSFPYIGTEAHAFLEVLENDGIQYVIVPKDERLDVWEVDR